MYLSGSGLFITGIYLSIHQSLWVPGTLTYWWKAGAGEHQAGPTGGGRRKRQELDCCLCILDPPGTAPGHIWRPHLEAVMPLDCSEQWGGGEREEGGAVLTLFQTTQEFAVGGISRETNLSHHIPPAPTPNSLSPSEGARNSHE